jgi:hypothetical protein
MQRQGDYYESGREKRIFDCYMSVMYGEHLREVLFFQIIKIACPPHHSIIKNRSIITRKMQGFVEVI